MSKEIRIELRCSLSLPATKVIEDYQDYKRMEGKKKTKEEALEEILLSFKQPKK